ncbi:hypothetical protein IWZ03DRAFT_387054 [Phyllosticta citriasiana]|uniref:Uncharacterized protein n=1 Tax=Phyllosticta citriasiana TaxID=595635 RepID=A0ABR1KBP2_9PEZI
MTDGRTALPDLIPALARLPAASSSSSLRPARRERAFSAVLRLAAFLRAAPLLAADPFVAVSCPCVGNSLVCYLPTYLPVSEVVRSLVMDGYLPVIIIIFFFFFFAVVFLSLSPVYIRISTMDTSRFSVCFSSHALRRRVVGKAGRVSSIGVGERDKI